MNEWAGTTSSPSGPPVSRRRYECIGIELHAIGHKGAVNVADAISGGRAGAHGGELCLLVAIPWVMVPFVVAGYVVQRVDHLAGRDSRRGRCWLLHLSAYESSGRFGRRCPRGSWGRRARQRREGQLPGWWATSLSFHWRSPAAGIQFNPFVITNKRRTSMAMASVYYQRIKEDHIRGLFSFPLPQNAGLSYKDSNEYFLRHLPSKPRHASWQDFFSSWRQANHLSPHNLGSCCCRLTGAKPPSM